MNGVLDYLLHSRRLVLASTVLLSLAGILAWVTMPREEDPQFPHRDGLIITFFPGADAETVERMVIEPLEEELAEIEEVNNVESTARAGVAIQHVEMLETVYDTDAAWDKVDDAVKAARREFPAGVSEPEVMDDMVSQEAIVLAVMGSGDPLQVLDAARTLKRELIAVDGVKEVTIVGNPGEQVTIEYDDAAARRLGLDPRTLGAQLSQRSQIVPGGVILLGDKTANLRPQTEFRSIDEIRATPILLPSGSSVPLEAIARVRLGPAEPARERMRWNGEPGIAIGVVPQNGIDRIEFGRLVRERLAEITPTLEPLRVEEVVFQPDMVADRLSHLTEDLQLSMLIVAGFLLLTMGLRLGLVVSAVIPLVTYGSLAVFAAGGGILHQISIAALVIGMGMVVDNAIVIAESVQYRLDRGEPAHTAAIASVRELAVPLGVSTGTTAAAFVPMLLSEGNTADFTRSIPILIMMTTVVSYFFALVVTPILSEMYLKPRRPASEADGEAPDPDAAEGLWRTMGTWMARVATGSPWLVMAATALMIAGSLAISPWMELRFFPAADRTTVVVDIEMPEGTNLEATDAVALRLERAMQEHPDVLSVGTFVGRAAPKFYYNLLSRPNTPQRAQLIAETKSLAKVEEMLVWVRDFASREIPEAEVVARRLEQGPPISAPIELRVLGSDFAALEQVADRLMAEMRAVPGTQEVRHDLGLGVPTVSFEIDDAAAARHGLSRADVALAMLGRTLGTEIGQYRQGEDPIPILVRSSAGEYLPVSDLATIQVARPGGAPVPLEQVAKLHVEWRPAVIQHHARQRVVHVQAQTAGDVTAFEVYQQLGPKVEALELPPGVKIQLGGELEESGKANSAIARTLPIGVLLLLFFLLVEFNSFRRVGIILFSVPLAVIGVIPGMILTQQPFGFMSILGLISLVGVVINNAIVLLDLIEVRRGEGHSIDEALREAVIRRTRPILLTAGTAALGLLPLAITDATLWPPLAWAIISGLTASTMLTLVVLPALYKLIFRRDERKAAELSQRGWAAPAAGIAGALFLLALLLPTPASAQEASAQETGTLTLQEAIARAASRPAALGADARALAAEQGAIAERRAALWPIVGVQAGFGYRDKLTTIETPFGAFSLGEKDSTSLALQVRQPLLDPSRLYYGVPAARETAAAAKLQASRLRQMLGTEAADRFLAVLEIDARLGATQAYVDSLDARLAEMRQRVDAGRVLEADALKIQLGLEAAQLERQALQDARPVALAALAQAIGSETILEPRWDGIHDRDQAFLGPEAQAVVDHAALAAEAKAIRHDLAALQAQVRALDLRALAIRKEILPRLEATAAYVRSDGDPLLPENLAQGTLGVTWTPFAAGTRGPRAAAAQAEADALRAQLQELERGVDLEVRAALADLQTARHAVKVRERGVELATETLRVEGERSSAGRATVNDLLDAEAALRQQRTARDLARLEILRSWVHVDAAVGRLGG